jgi:hypothetical protein
MPRPKSVLLRLEVDTAQRSHPCQHNPAHRLQKGDKRLKVTKNRSPEHFCIACAIPIIDKDVEKLRSLADQLLDQ